MGERLVAAGGEPAWLAGSRRRRAVLAALFVVATLVGRSAQADGAHLAIFWPASAVGLLWLAGSPGRRARSVDVALLVAGTVALRLLTGMPVGESTALALSAAVQALAGAWSYRVLQPGGFRLTTVAHLRNLALASVAGAVVSVPLALVAFALADVPAGLVALQWTVRTSVSTFVVLAVVLRAGERCPDAPGGATRLPERALQGVAFVVVHVLAFWVFAGYAVTFLVLLVAVWVALRRTTTLAVVHVVVVAAVVVTATWSGGSPWRDLPPDLQALCAEAFIGTLGLITMTLALYRDEGATAAARAAEAERAATEQADLLTAVFGSISDAVCVFDAAGDSLLRNPAADRLLGGGRRNARSDWGGRISFHRPDGTEFPDAEVPIVRALRGEAVDGVDLLLRSAAHPGGILLNVSAHPLPRERGAVWSGGVVAAFHDVSEVRAASTRVAAAHELLSNVLAAATGHSIIAADTGGRITVFNEGAERMLGWDAAEVLGGDALLVRDPQEVRALARAHGLAHPRDLFARPASAGASTERSTYVRRDGSTLPVSLTTSPMRAADGALLGWIGMATDVSELENSEELFRIALEAAPVGVVMVAAAGAGAGRVLQVNRAMCRFTGRAEEDLLGKPFVALGTGWPAFGELFADVLSGARREQRVDLVLDAAGDRRLAVEVSATLVRPRGREATLLCLVEDVTERRASHRELRHLALHDPLTGLPNRALFVERLDHAVAAASGGDGQVGVLYVDLDGFKAVNDTAGHQAGDDLLVRVAELLSACVRPGDTVARLGGDEFAIVCTGTFGEDDVVAVGQRVLEGLREPITVRGHLASVGASIGVRWCRGDSSADQLLRDADEAMYAAKRAGKGRVVVHRGQGTLVAAGGTAADGR